MAIVLDIVLVSDRYDAGHGLDPRRPEWPPHPARVLSALRSVARPEELDSLREFERLGPPMIHAAEVVSEPSSRTYVVTNRVEADGGNLTHVGRSSGLRQRRATVPLTPRVQFTWPSAEVTVESVRRLDDIARRVPYLGRSTSVVLMGARHVGDTTGPNGLDTWEPCPAEEAELWLRVPYAGYIDELDALYAADSPAWQASDGGRASQPYRRVTPHDGDATAHSGQPSPVETPYRDLLVLRFEDRRPPGRLIPILTAALRSMVMTKTGDPLPAAVHGHGIDGQPHVAYLGLPVTGHRHADGHLVGLAVAIPGMSPDERRRVLRGILAGGSDGQVTLDVPQLGSIRLAYDPAARLPKTALAETWTTQSTQWVSVTPVVLDRYPKRGDIESALRETFLLSGLPEPAHLEISPSTLTPGAISLAPRELPKRALGRVYRHVRVRFDQPVAGPLLVGAGRYFGIGLFAPERQGAHHAR